MDGSRLSKPAPGATVPLHMNDKERSKPGIDGTTITSREAFLRAVQIGPMRADDVPEIMPLETILYPFPWSAGNFRDSLAAGYSGWVLRDPPHQNGPALKLLGYAVVMHVLDEAHLMNLSVTQTRQRQGLGRHFLSWLCEKSAHNGAAGMFLEVRPSNAPALSLYAQADFRRVGLRRNYYPNGDQGREDAVVMRKSLLGGGMV